MRALHQNHFRQKLDLLPSHKTNLSIHVNHQLLGKDTVVNSPPLLSESPEVRLELLDMHFHLYLALLYSVYSPANLVHMALRALPYYSKTSSFYITFPSSVFSAIPSSRHQHSHLQFPSKPMNDRPNRKV